MKNKIKRVYNLWLKFGQIIGNIISSIVLFAFYYTFWALVAIPYKLFTKNYFDHHKLKSSWVEKRKNIERFEDFEEQ